MLVGMESDTHALDTQQIDNFDSSRIKICDIKEEIIGDIHKRQLQTLDKKLISRAKQDAEDSDHSPEKDKTIKIGFIKMTRPTHLLYDAYTNIKQVEVEVEVEPEEGQAASTRPKTKKIWVPKEFLGIETKDYCIVNTHNFEDFVESTMHAKDRFSLENYVKKLAMKKGFKVYPATDKGVTKRDFK